MSLVRKQELTKPVLSGIEHVRTSQNDGIGPRASLESSGAQHWRKSGKDRDGARTRDLRHL